MIGLSEILIVVFGFGLAAFYLYCVGIFIRKADQETAEADQAERFSKAA